MQFMRRAILGFIRIYQIALAPLIGPCCRYQPGCSRYMAEAVQRHGVWRGLGLGIRRVARCHPWGGSGYDPVPPAETEICSANHTKAQ